MEFTDIAMELSKEAWQASFHHPFIKIDWFEAIKRTAGRLILFF